MYSPPTFMNEGVCPEFYLSYPMPVIKQEIENDDLLLTSGYYPSKNEPIMPFGIDNYEIPPDMYCFAPTALSSPASNYSYRNSPIETSSNYDYFDPINTYQTFSPPFESQWADDFYQSPPPPPQPTTVLPKTVKKSKKATKNPDDRPFQCHLCHRAFARKHDLQRHIRVHTGDKPYSCPCCKKAFARTDALKRHLRMEEECRESHQVQSMKGTGRRKFRDL